MINIKDNLFAKSNTQALKEYDKELLLLKEIITLLSEKLEKQKVGCYESYEGVCYLFAKSVIEYCKMIYDNILLGHLETANIVSRTMIENMVLLEVIMNSNKVELWKFYYVHSEWKRIYQLYRNDPQKQKCCMDEICTPLNLSRRVLQGHMDETYGWTFPIGLATSFRKMCEMVNENIYAEYELLCEYAHGTSFYQKVSNKNNTQETELCISCIYYRGIVPLVRRYFGEEGAEKLVKLKNEFEKAYESSLEDEYIILSESDLEKGYDREDSDI